MTQVSSLMKDLNLKLSPLIIVNIGTRVPVAMRTGIFQDFLVWQLGILRTH